MSSTNMRGRNQLTFFTGRLDNPMSLIGGILPNELAANMLSRMPAFPPFQDESRT